MLAETVVWGPPPEPVIFEKAINEPEVYRPGRTVVRAQREMQKIPLTIPQWKLVATTAPFPAFVGGYGSGKSEALITRALRLKSKYPKNNLAYYMPTYDLVRNLAYPRFEAKFEQYKICYRLNKAYARIEFPNHGEIIFRTMDSPQRIIAYEVGDSLVDEIDTLKDVDAENVWNKILARNRQRKYDGGRNTIAVATTPEGFRFVYRTWKKEEGKARSMGYSLIKASTWSNVRNIGRQYILDLMNRYPSNLISAYIDGEFVNLTGGAIYNEFDRTLNASVATIIPNDILHIGMDFNVMKMAAVVHVMRGGDPHAVNELIGLRDTPDMIRAIKARWPNHSQIHVYPDASGDSKKSVNASTSDIAMLRAAGFGVHVNASNPRVKDRVLSMNALIHVNGRRRYRVNPNGCPTYVDCLEKQVWDDKGEPDKTAGFDHPNDAAGYFICYTFPVRKPQITKTQLGGI